MSKMVGEESLSKFMAIIKDEVKNNVSGGGGTDLEKLLAESFYTKDELVSVINEIRTSTPMKYEITPGFTNDFVWHRIDTGINSPVSKVLCNEGKYVFMYDDNYISVSDDMININTIDLSQIAETELDLKFDTSLYLLDIEIFNGTYIIGGTASISNTRYLVIFATEDFSNYYIKYIYANDTSTNKSRRFTGFHYDGSSLYIATNYPNILVSYNFVENENVGLLGDLSGSTKDYVVTLKSFSYTGNSNRLIYIDNMFVGYGAYGTTSQVPIAMGLDGGTIPVSSSGYLYPAFYILGNKVYYVRISLTSNIPTSFLTNLIYYTPEGVRAIVTSPSVAITSAQVSDINPDMNINLVLYAHGKYFCVSRNKGFITDSIDNINILDNSIETFTICDDDIKSITHNYDYIIAGLSNGNIIYSKM